MFHHFVSSPPPSFSHNSNPSSFSEYFTPNFQQFETPEKEESGKRYVGTYGFSM